MSNIAWARFKNWLRESWPAIFLTIAAIALVALGFGIGYVTAGRQDRAPIVIEQGNCPPH